MFVFHCNCYAAMLAADQMTLTGNEPSNNHLIGSVTLRKCNLYSPECRSVDGFLCKWKPFTISWSSQNITTVESTTTKLTDWMFWVFLFYYYYFTWLQDWAWLNLKHYEYNSKSRCLRHQNDTVPVCLSPSGGEKKGYEIWILVLSPLFH